MSLPRITFWLAAVLAAPGTVPGFAANCESLATLALPAATIVSAQSVPGPPAVCRLAVSLKPSSDSGIQVEVWLPETGWNGTLVPGGGRSRERRGADTSPLPYPQVARYQRTGSTDDAASPARPRSRGRS
jgi:hypothetical protein